MKKIKISVFAVVAVLLGIIGSAFTSAEPVNTQEGWFMYNYTTAGPLNDPESYDYVTSIAPCNAHVKFCAFKGVRDTDPSIPTQESLDAALEESPNFEIEVDDLVIYRPQ